MNNQKILKKINLLLFIYIVMSLSFIHGSSYTLIKAKAKLEARRTKYPCLLRGAHFIPICKRKKKLLCIRVSKPQGKSFFELNKVSGEVDLVGIKNNICRLIKNEHDQEFLLNMRDELQKRRAYHQSLKRYEHLVRENNFDIEFLSFEKNKDMNKIENLWAKEDYKEYFNEIKKYINIKNSSINIKDISFLPLAFLVRLSTNKKSPRELKDLIKTIFNKILEDHFSSFYLALNIFVKSEASQLEKYMPFEYIGLYAYFNQQNNSNNKFDSKFLIIFRNFLNDMQKIKKEKFDDFSIQIGEEEYMISNLKEEIEKIVELIEAEEKILASKQEELKKERLEQERIEQERIEQERLEQERLEQERLEQERLEQERLEKERLEKEELEEEKLEQEKLEQEKLEQEKRFNDIICSWSNHHDDTDIDV